MTRYKAKMRTQEKFMPKYGALCKNENIYKLFIFKNKSELKKIRKKIVTFMHTI